MNMIIILGSVFYNWLLLPSLRYENGPICAAVNELVSLLSSFLEVEELFNNSEADYAGKALQLKRTEMTVNQLMICQRSHQMLRLKNRFILKLFELIRSRQGTLNTQPPS